MPIHDWTRVDAGTWHAFHVSWISELQGALNDGILPEGFYAQAEQVIGPYGPDVLAMQSSAPKESPSTNGVNGMNSSAHQSKTGGIALATSPPRTQIQMKARMPDYTDKQRLIAIRHTRGDRVVSLIELVSPGNKSSRDKWNAFIGKAVGCIYEGYHLLLVDLFPPSPRDPDGLHVSLWSRLGFVSEAIPPPDPLTLVSYALTPEITAYLEPTAVGKPLIEMPLFLSEDHYVNVPLESTYASAFRHMPKQFKTILQNP